jgi:uncharacterized protein YkwD
MLDPACRGTTSTRAALGAALTLLFALPATAAAQTPPLPAPLPQAPTIPSTPSISLPLTVAAAQSCPGARRRSGTRARQAAVGCLVNKARTSAGLRGFRWSSRLARAATRHARDMSRRGYFAHQRSGGPSLGRRVRAAGFRGRNVGEAIAYGCGSLSTPASIVRAWLGSPPHRAILLSRRSRVGVGVSGRPPVGCGGRGATYVLDAG